MENKLKEAFSKVKEEINSLKEEIKALQVFMKNQKEMISTQDIPIEALSDRQTDQQRGDQGPSTPKGPGGQDSPLSIGNRGVPTDRQTDQQTDRQTEISSGEKALSDFRKANEMMASLDEIRRDIRSKFKELTSQEMRIFIELYSLEERGIQKITYKTLSERLNLSESSIRDYVCKLLKKGIPVERSRQNNKVIFLNISSDLKNLASLETILHLRRV